jgi:hypothetical protein
VLIKALGDGRSNAYLRYIEVTSDLRQAAAKDLAQKIHAEAMNLAKQRA